MAVLFVFVVLVLVSGVVAGTGAPGVSRCLATAETRSVKPRIEAVQICRKVFTL